MPEALFDIYGRARKLPPEAELRGMHQPVRCRHCGGVYDLGTVEVIQRYADCSVWITPCCNNTHDDRREWGSDRRRCYEELRAVGSV
jgi:hypothetical protein